MQQLRKRLAILLGLALSALLPRPLRAASAARVEHVGVAFHGDRLFVTMHLVGELPTDVADRLEAGQEIAFEYLVQLRRTRKNFTDKTVFQRYVVVTARYNSLTRMYNLSRRVDGTVTDSDLTDRESVMRHWMQEFVDLPLFEPRDFDAAGVHYVRAKAKLQTRFRLLFVPADLETDWEESERFERARGKP